MAEAAEPPGPAGPPSRLLASPVMLLIALGRIAREELDDVLAGDGLSLRHLGALGHLRRTPRLSYSGLGRRAGVTAQSMQATVSHLERIGAVSRSDATGRGRAADLTVTSAGVAALGVRKQLSPRSRIGCWPRFPATTVRLSPPPSCTSPERCGPADDNPMTASCGLLRRPPMCPPRTQRGRVPAWQGPSVARSQCGRAARRLSRSVRHARSHAAP